MTAKPLIKKQFNNFLFSKTPVLKSQRVVIDFSSPNIAKPFHPGHLRATLLGNFISNINVVFGHDVHKINYLGDWGKQFGFLMHGLSVFKKGFKIEENSMKDLFEVYVRSNKEFITEEHLLSIRQITSKLENGDKDLKEHWSKIKSVSMENLQNVYKRLGVEFDTYEFESDYADVSKEIIKKLRINNKSFHYHDGATCYALDDENHVILLTKEGSSLYMTRDMAAAISRHEAYKPDRVHYVVEIGQSLHFERLQRILADLGYGYNNESNDFVPKDFHIKFGRVMGMSTRSGNVIFLDDILDHAKSLMLTSLRSKEHTSRTSDDKLDETAEALGRTIIFCEFLRAPRTYNFNYVWNRDNLGFRLQYCRVSLNSLERRCAELSIESDFADCFDMKNYEYFDKYPQASELLKHISKFDEVLWRCYLESESCHLINYVTKMTGLIHLSLRELNIINCSVKSEAQLRLKLFSVSKFILDFSYRILGLPIVERI